MRALLSKVRGGVGLLACAATACGSGPDATKPEAFGQTSQALAATTPPPFIAVHDAFVDSSSPGQTGARSAVLFAGRRGTSGGYGAARALLWFDVSSIPSTSVIVSATLTLDSIKVPSNNNVTSALFGLYPVTQGWTSGTVPLTTANGPPPNLKAPLALEPTWSIPYDANTELASFTVPYGSVTISTTGLVSAVQTWASYINYGLLIKAKDELSPCPSNCPPTNPTPPRYGRGFTSIEATTGTKPKLSVAYCPPPNECQNAPTYSGGNCNYASKANGTACTDDGNVCTTDTCQSGACSHPAGHAGTQCRAANGTCDVADSCNGTSTSCPDAKRPSTYVCRPAVTAPGCDIQEKCDGTTNACPADAFQPNTFVCRVASPGSCDVAEKCTGSSVTCPADAKAASGTACTDDGNTCTTDRCDSSGNCTHPAGNAGIVCRAAAGPCDIAESCNGTSTSCPADSVIGGCVQWPPPTELEQNTQGDSANVRIAVNATGDAMVVWQQSDGTRSNIWARRWVSSTSTWAPATLVETDNTGNAQNPAVGIDASGNAIAVWQQFDGTRYNAMANRFTPSAGWGATPVALENKTGTVLSPAVAVSPFGQAVAVFGQAETTSGYRMWATRFSGTWSAPVAVDGVATMEGAPSVAIDPTGTALMAWGRQATSGARYVLYGGRFAPGGWTYTGIADNAGTDNVFAVDVAVDQSGNGLAAYTREDSSFIDHPWAARFSVAGGWASPKRLDPTNTGNTTGERVAFSPSGDGVVVWQYVDGNAIKAQRYLASSGWGAMTTINVPASTTGTPSVAVDQAGNAVAVWVQGGHVLSSEMSPVGVWGAPLQVDGGATSVGSSKVVATPNGTFMGAWTQKDGSSPFYHTFADTIRLSQPAAVPPAVYTVVECGGPTSGPCTEVAQPNAQWTIYQGNVLTPNEVLHGGQVLVDSNGVIACVACDCFPQTTSPPTTIQCPSAVISPGLINTHDHIGYAANGPQHDSTKYDNRQQWRDSPTYTYNGKTNDTTILAAAEFRQLMSGTTSVVSEQGNAGLLRNLQSADWMEGDAAIVPLVYHTFPFQNGTTGYSANCNYPDQDTSATYAAYDAYFPHLAEGIDANANSEFECAAAAGTNQLLSPKTTAIHAMAINAPDAQALYQTGTFVSWAPRSEINLYANTTPVSLLHTAGVPIALGTDWVVSGSVTLLRELKCADSFNGQYLSHYFSDFQLWQMVTTNAAFAAGADQALGMLKPGYIADLAIFNATTNLDHRAVIAAEPDDVLLVVRAGQALYGDSALMQALSPSCTDPVTTCATTRVACTPSETAGGKTFQALSAAIAPFYPLLSCGPPVGEPTCVPTRAGYPLLSNDPDGDGIVNDGTDRCPNIFAPIRPMDNGQQVNADPASDNVPDFCDVCPNGPCTPPNADDLDADGVMNGRDDCPGVANADQTDTDADGKGDACDACPTVPNVGVRPCPVDITIVRDPSQPGHTPLNFPAFVKSLVVTGVRPATVKTNGFYAQTVPERDFGGIFVSTTRHVPSVAPGDVVDVVGSYQGETTLSTLANAIATGTGTTSSYAVLAAAPDSVMEGGNLTKRWESMVVSVGPTVVLNQFPDATDFDEFTVGTISPGLRVDDELYWALDNVYPAGTHFSKLQGVLTFSFSNHKLVPRSATDFATP